VRLPVSVFKVDLVRNNFCSRETYFALKNSLSIKNLMLITWKAEEEKLCFIPKYLALSFAYISKDGLGFYAKRTLQRLIKHMVQSRLLCCNLIRYKYQPCLLTHMHTK
jgi:hypothetical protein